jgi:3-oxoacyl-[acyl-carrier protein] reductase
MNSNMPTETEYGALKAALISYSAQMATRLGPDNIRVNSVSPGPIYHENGFWQMVEQKQPELFKRVESLSVFNRIGTAQEVANAVVFLASPAASNITGTNLRVDGATIKTVNF